MKFKYASINDGRNNNSKKFFKILIPWSFILMDLCSVGTLLEWLVSMKKKKVKIVHP